MNQKRLMLCLAMMAVLFAGCQKPQADTEGNGPQSSIEERGPQKPLTTRMPGGNSVRQVQGASKSDGTTTAFQAGTWLGTKDDGSQQYYFFSADGSSGQIASLESGTGLGFAYEAASGQAVFHMGSADDRTPCTVKAADGGQITLQWENGGTETLKYVSSLGAEEFTFYTNDELCELALAYYRLTGGAASQNLTAGAEGNEDGTVNIQVYENLGDHNSTAAGYVIDRLTGKGTDANTGETVDLTVMVQ